MRSFHPVYCVKVNLTLNTCRSFNNPTRVSTVTTMQSTTSMPRELLLVSYGMFSCNTFWIFDGRLESEGKYQLYLIVIPPSLRKVKTNFRERIFEAYCWSIALWKAYTVYGREWSSYSTYQVYCSRQAPKSFRTPKSYVRYPHPPSNIQRTVNSCIAFDTRTWLYTVP